MDRFLSSLFLLLSLEVVSAGNVLFGGMHASQSHIGSMMPFAVRMTQENHSVHFLESYTLPNSYRFPPCITPHFFKLPGDEIYTRQVLGLMWTRTYDAEVMSQVYSVADKTFLDIMKTYPEKIGGLLNASWDLQVVDELFGLTSMGLALKHKKKNRTIIQSTTSTINAYTWEMGLVLQRLFINLSTPLPPPFSLVSQRRQPQVRRIQVLHAASHYHHWNSRLRDLSSDPRTLQRGRHESHRNPRFSFFKLWNESAFNFIEEITTFIFPSPISNDIKAVGKSCKKAKSLNKEFLDFVDDPMSKGTIYIAFGTNVLWEFAPEYIMKAFFNTIDRLADYRVVFTYNGLKINKTIPGHVKIVSWSPQLDLLSHKRTKLYITHGGLKSVKEAICTSTPLVILPLFAEQTFNAALALKLGIGKSLNKYTLTEDKLYKSIISVLEEPKYAAAVAKHSQMFTDLPIPALDEGAFYANRAIRLKDEILTLRLRVQTELVCGSARTYCHNLCGCLGFVEFVMGLMKD
ncbi:hypothetical protein L596_030092 [Steinernema carpocapsae]|uniref:UDP-glucuronosyltransferase n=2 Tax=Steinernema carpocapsae TaxID=34508 RepID=A0A4U5LRP6_STECR|nr:hypothetical protein L596_030092 [Steinernema carpocapsae]